MLCYLTMSKRWVKYFGSEQMCSDEQFLATNLHHLIHHYSITTSFERKHYQWITLLKTGGMWRGILECVLLFVLLMGVSGVDMPRTRRQSQRWKVLIFCAHGGLIYDLALQQARTTKARESLWRYETLHKDGTPDSICILLGSLGFPEPLKPVMVHFPLTIIRAIKCCAV